MHDIEPYSKWRDLYVASEDQHSPFYGHSYDEFHFTKKIYNYFIHPQWDFIGSPTLYMKLLYTDYEKSFCIIELIGEWNDCLHNDIMYLKREIIDHLIKRQIHKFAILCDNVLNFHSDDDCYYEEWYDDVKEENGWIFFLNTRPHVLEEMQQVQIGNYVELGNDYNDINWRSLHPKGMYSYLQNKCTS